MAYGYAEADVTITDLLGGKKVFSKPTMHSGEMRDAVRKGLPYEAFEALLAKMELRPQELIALMGLAPRTHARRRKTRQLTPAESDRLYRVAYVVKRTTEVLGDLRKARTWMSRPNRALGGETPISLLDTDIGSRQVEEVLERINHGVFG